MGKIMLIGLLGYARSGKDEACRQLGFARCAFADALKAAVDPLFPADTLKEIKRDTYVAYGRAMRRIDPDYWLKQLVIPDALNVCCTDVRYVNECRHLLDRGARLFWVRRFGTGPANDEEETSFEAIRLSDVYRRVEIVPNDGTAEQLGDRLRAAMGMDKNVATCA